MDRSLSKGFDRRTLLKLGGGALALSALDLVPGGRLLGGTAFAGAAEYPGFNLEAAPFTLGVASGDPLPRSVVLWTRLADDPFDGGGSNTRGVPVDWEVAADENFSRVVQRGRILAGPEYGYSVHVDVQGLRPARTYWYRFQANGVISPVGRTRTAPAYNTPLTNLNFAFASCQQWQQGFFTAYGHMAEQDLDLVVHLGDYIYEGNHNIAARPYLPPEQAIPEPTDLASYRNRYALYKLDADLQTAHAAFPFIVTWDDHEVENNYADDISQIDTEPDQDPAVFLQRRAAAYRAWYEHMPVRASQMPAGPDLLNYRRFRFGDLAEFNVLDTRQYRDDQPCGDGVGPACDELLDPSRTFLGEDQEKWLFEGLSASRTRWNVLAQQIFMSDIDFVPGEAVGLNRDSWAGYPGARQRVLDYIRDQQVQDVVVLTGDIHTNWVADVKENFADPNSATLATEFVGTSITSNGDGSDEVSVAARAYLQENPWIKFLNNRRGFVQCSVDQNRWQSEYKVLPFVSQPGAPISTRATWVVESGRPGAVQTSGDPTIPTV